MSCPTFIEQTCFKDMQRTLKNKCHVTYQLLGYHEKGIKVWLSPYRKAAALKNKFFPPPPPPPPESISTQTSQNKRVPGVIRGADWDSKWWLSIDPRTKYFAKSIPCFSFYFQPPGSIYPHPQSNFFSQSKPSLWHPPESISYCTT